MRWITTGTIKRDRVARACLSGLLVIAGALCVPAPLRAAEPLRLVATIPLPGVEGRIDHMDVDMGHQRLFVSALGNGTVEVIDLKAGKRLQSLRGFREAQGVGYDRATNCLVVANGGSGDCDFLDGTLYHRLSKVSLGEDADDIRMDEAAHIAIVGYGEGALAFLDMTTRKLVGSAAFPGHPEAFASGNRRVYVNVPSQGRIVVIDRSNLSVTASWPVTQAQANFPMALDNLHHRLFIGCRNPARMLVYSTDTGNVVSSYPIVGDTDDIFYDASRRRLYVTGGEGFIDVFAQESPDLYKRLQHIPTAFGARTSLFVPGSARLYVAIPHRGARSAALFVYATAP